MLLGVWVRIAQLDFTEQIIIEIEIIVMVRNLKNTQSASAWGKHLSIYKLSSEQRDYNRVHFELKLYRTRKWNNLQKEHKFKVTFRTTR